MRLWDRIERLLVTAAYRILLPMMNRLNRWGRKVVEKQRKAQAPLEALLEPDFEPSSTPVRALTELKVMCAICNYQFEIRADLPTWEVPCPFCDSKSVMMVPVE